MEGTGQMSVPFSFMMPHPVTRALTEPPGIPASGSPGVSSWAHREAHCFRPLGSIVVASSQGPAQDGQLPLGGVWLPGPGESRGAAPGGLNHRRAQGCVDEECRLRELRLRGGRACVKSELPKIGWGSPRRGERVTSGQSRVPRGPSTGPLPCYSRTHRPRARTQLKVTQRLVSAPPAAPQPRERRRRGSAATSLGAARAGLRAVARGWGRGLPRAGAPAGDSGLL